MGTVYRCGFDSTNESLRVVLCKNTAEWLDGDDLLKRSFEIVFRNANDAQSTSLGASLRLERVGYV